MRLVVALLAVALLAEVGAHLAFSGNRRAVVRVMSSLSKGMPRVEAERIVESEAAHFFLRRPSASGLVCVAHAGLARDWGLQLRFTEDGHLASAAAFTEDGPYHPTGVPPDIQ